MTDGVNVLDNGLRSTVTKQVDFIPGAWVSFWDSVIIGDIKKAQGSKDSKSIDDTISFLVAQIAGWNFTDTESALLPVTNDTFEKFSTKLLNWFTTAQKEVLEAQLEDKKKSPASSSNTSEQNTPIA